MSSALEKAKEALRWIASGFEGCECDGDGEDDWDARVGADEDEWDDHASFCSTYVRGYIWAKLERLERLSDVESLSSKASAAGYHLRFDSPFQKGDKHHVGLTPHGFTGGNGRADHRFNGTLEEAVEEASAFLNILAKEIPPEIRIDEEDGWTVRCENYFLGQGGSYLGRLEDVNILDNRVGAEVRDRLASLFEQAARSGTPS